MTEARNNKRFIPGRGPHDARIAIIGESPGRNEDTQGKPFVGASGHLMERWMRDAGIDPASCYYDNVYPYYPPAGKIVNVDTNEIAYWTDNLHSERLLKLRNPVVLIPMGNVALTALTGITKTRENESLITKWRGSILQNGLTSSLLHPVKIIPTLHPAAVLHSGGGHEREEEGFSIQIPWEKRCRLDWKRIAEESQTRDYPVPNRRHICDPPQSSPKLHELREKAMSPEEVLAIDIETPNRKEIVCVGFSIDPSWSVVIPFDKVWQKQVIKVLCESDCQKALHNGYGFDAYWLWQEKIPITNFYWDTMAMHHTLDPCEEHSLQFLTSVYTKEPYYKDEGKFEALDGVLRRNFPQLMQYCGKDCCVTREIFDVLYELLEGEEIHAEY